jgi:hypothetical protein
MEKLEMTKKLTEEQKKHNKEVRETLKLCEWKTYGLTISTSACLDSVVNSMSDKSRCLFCRKLIAKNTIRGSMIGKIQTRSYPIQIRRYCCSECAVNRIKNDIVGLKTALKLIKKEISSTKRKKYYEKQNTIRLKEEMLGELENDG